MKKQVPRSIDALVRRPKVVVKSIIEHNGKILLLRRPEGKKFPLMLDYPGGKYENGESLEAAALRELKEETGIVMRRLDLHDVSIKQYSDARAACMFLIVYRGVTETADVELSDEHIAYAWMSPKKVDKTRLMPSLVPSLDRYIASRYHR